jgi:hypothetical protein
VSSMLEPDRLCIGIHSAALAIDGARLLLGSNLTLCARSIREMKADICVGSTTFFSFRDIVDIDDYVKAALVSTWAANARSSVEFLADAIRKERIGREERETCEEWLKLVVPFLFGGMSDAIEALSNKSSS